MRFAGFQLVEFWRVVFQKARLIWIFPRCELEILSTGTDSAMTQIVDVLGGLHVSVDELGGSIRVPRTPCRPVRTTRRSFGAKKGESGSGEDRPLGVDRGEAGRGLSVLCSVSLVEVGGELLLSL